MKLIVGLGNPGKNYNNTRHNVGFMAIDSYCNKNNLEFKNKFNGLYAKLKKYDDEILFLKPQSFMNLSGLVVKKYIDFFKIKIKDILIIYDDKDFEIGKFKIKPSGSSGGHNGIKNIIDNIKTTEFKKIRIGISNNSINLINYVLGKFSKKELNIINEIINQIDFVIEDYMNLDFNNLMNKYNK